MRLALYHPEIPQNTGTLLRLGACLGVPLDLIEPCGFVPSDARLRRAGMDYAELAKLTRHSSWEDFELFCETHKRRTVLLCPRADVSYLDFTFTPQDTLLLGTESSGVPESVAHAVEARVRIPMHPGRRSLNVAISGAMVLSEALRQTGLMPL
ncbi:MAG: tRNA methyltransferase [Candidatus Puniceispirillum sp.]|nr:tRNA methyltransferase [Candidatus Puniceispirillum sp.]